MILSAAYFYHNEMRSLVPPNVSRTTGINLLVAMDILLHICCGPCLIYPLSRLKNQGFKISGFYYNPNIYPISEYYRRVEALKVLSQEFSLHVEYPEHEESDFFQAVDTQENLPQRCVICWRLRLRKTAQKAKEGGFSVFSTTLLVSPYQDHQLLKELGRQIGQEAGIDFYYEDFGPVLSRRR